MKINKKSKGKKCNFQPSDLICNFEDNVFLYLINKLH